jgi:hypothetical protein
LGVLRRKRKKPEEEEKDAETHEHRKTCPRRESKAI